MTSARIGVVGSETLLGWLAAIGRQAKEIISGLPFGQAQRDDLNHREVHRDDKV